MRQITKETVKQRFDEVSAAGRGTKYKQEDQRASSGRHGELSRGKLRETEHGKAFMGAGTDIANAPPHSSLVPTASSSSLLLSLLTYHGSQWLPTSRIHPPLPAGLSGQVHVW